jgi:hypothetical protein
MPVIPAPMIRTRPEAAAGRLVSMSEPTFRAPSASITQGTAAIGPKPGPGLLKHYFFYLYLSRPSAFFRLVASVAAVLCAFYVTIITRPGDALKKRVVAVRLSNQPNGDSTARVFIGDLI